MMRKLISIILLIVLITYWRWVFNWYIISYGDWSFFFLDAQKEFLNFPFGWINSGLGDVGVAVLPMYPANVLWGILAFVTNFSLSERLLYFFPAIFFGSFGSFFLIRKILKSNIGSFIGFFVFSYNTYFLIGDTGHLTLMAAFALAPWALLLFMKTLEEKKLEKAVLTGLVFFIVSFYEIRAFYILAWVCFFYFLWYTFIIDQISWKTVFRNGLSAFFPIALVVLLNLYWIIGLMKLGAITDNVIFDRGLFGNSFMNIEEALTLFHPFWTGGASAIFRVQSIPLHFFLIPIFAFVGLWLNRKSKNVLFFGCISLFGILLSKQVGAPFEELYLWLYTHFPGFNAFRESSKFYFLIALGYSVLIGSFVSWIWNHWTEKGATTYAKYALTAIIAVLFLWNTKPILTGEFGTLFVPRHVPQDYLIVKDFILEQPEEFRTLWVPTSSRWSIYLNSKSKANLIDLVQSVWQSLSRTNNASLPTENRITSILKSPFANSLLDISSMRYVIIPLQDTENDDDFFKDYGDRQFFIDELDQLSYLQRIDIGTKDVIVYENENARPHIYSTKEKETIYGDIPFSKVEYQSVNPTQYSVSLKNISAPVYVNFSESYHPDWKLRAGDFQWFDVLTKKDYFLPDTDHSQNDAKLNSFLIDPAYIRQHLSKDQYRENPDGSIDVDLTLYFKPQSYFYFGLIISGTTLVGCLGYLGYAGIRSYRRRKNGSV